MRGAGITALALCLAASSACVGATATTAEEPITAGETDSERQIRFIGGEPGDVVRLERVDRSQRRARECRLPCSLAAPASKQVEVSLVRGAATIYRTRVWTSDEPESVALPPAAGSSSDLIALGRRFRVMGVPKVVLWSDPDGVSLQGCGSRCMTTRPGMPVGAVSDPTPAAFEALQSQVAVLALHTVIGDFREVYQPSEGARPSTHFVIDWDGTIYQVADVGLATRHTALDEFSQISVGVDLQGPGVDLLVAPDAEPYAPSHPGYPHRNEPEHARAKSPQTWINHFRVQAYGYTEAQYRALGALSRALLRLFPKISRRFPVDDDGRVDANIRFEFRSGLIAHWHISITRWDPGPGFDWARLAREIGAPPPKPPMGTPPEPLSPEALRKRREWRERRERRRRGR